MLKEALFQEGILVKVTIFSTEEGLKDYVQPGEVLFYFFSISIFFFLR